MNFQVDSIRAVLFDWGGTLVVDVPASPGSGEDGPRVEAMPGAADALRALHGRYTLVLATNSALSDRRRVRKALARAGLEPYVSVVITAADVGARKPDRKFFQAALHRIGCRPSEAAMVGDSYGADIVGAKGAGLRAIWLNPARVRCPLVHPVHDAEIRELPELPDLLSRPFLPDLAAALDILWEHRVPPNVVQHSVAVAAVAHHLALWLRERGERLDPLLVHRGALLHDLDKVTSDKPADHGERAGRILREHGWPALAGIAARHVLGAVPETWEEVLVHYADKIVDEDRVVGLVERVTSLSCRYASQGAQIARALPQLLALEQEIIAALSASREEILAELQALDLRLPPVVTPQGSPYDRTE